MRARRSAAAWRIRPPRPACFEALAVELMDLDAPPERIEVYDNSHIMRREMPSAA